MTAWLFTALGVVVVALGAWLRHSLRQAMLERKRDDELEKIIVRSEKAREAIDAKTTENVAAVPGKSDAELEEEINR